MPYFTNCIQYITEIDSIDVIALYLFIQQFFIILTFQSQISLCTENSYIPKTILQPDLQPKIYLVLGLWSYLVAKTDFHGLTQWTYLGPKLVCNNTLFFRDIINVTVRSELLSGACNTFINLHQIIWPLVILTEKIRKSYYIKIFSRGICEFHHKSQLQMPMGIVYFQRDRKSP